MSNSSFSTINFTANMVYFILKFVYGEMLSMGCVFQFFLIVLFFSISEVSLLLWVATEFNILFTIACCALTGLLGGYFVRQQGLITMDRIRTSLAKGEIPADEAVGGLMLLIVGILLCVPGFITDTLGFLIIIPFVRRFVANAIVKHFTAMIKSGNTQFYTNFSAPTSDYNQDETISSATSTSATPTQDVIEDAHIVEADKE